MILDPPTVIVRADASTEIGLGHIMRSRTLALALVELGCRTTISGSRLSHLPPTGNSSLNLDDRPSPAGGGADALRVADLQPQFVIIDGYHFSPEFFGVLGRRKIPYAVIDDNAETVAVSPVAILNPNPHASSDLYGNVAVSTTLLLGLDFALIRPEVVDMALRPPPREANAVLVAMGGSDPRRLTVPVTAALADSGLMIRVAVGPGVHNRSEVISSVERLGAAVVPPGSYERALAASRVAVLAAGSSLWEAAAVATPTVALVVAENQGELAAEAHRIGLAVATIDLQRGGFGRHEASELAVALQSVSRSSGATGSLDLRGAERSAERLLSAAGFDVSRRR